MDDALLTKAEQAERLLRALFAENLRIKIRDAQAEARRQRISPKTLTEARKRLGATEIHNGPFPGFWQAPEIPPADQTPTDTHGTGVGRGVASEADS